MFHLTKQRTISQIMAFRKAKTIKKKIKDNTVDLSTQSALDTNTNNIQSKTDYLLKKTTYYNQDKLLLLKHIQRKYRIHFDHSLGLSLINLINVKQKIIIDKYYDSNYKSYFMIKGKMIIEKIIYMNRQHSIYQNNSNYQNKGYKYVQIACFQGQKGIGKIFSDQQYCKVTIKCQNAVVLQIIHNDKQYLQIEEHCLMTFQQKQIFVMGLNLFKNLDNVNRYYIPFFKSKKVSKGQMIYAIGQKCQYFYLIVQGEIQFESKLNLQILEPTQSTAITQLILKNQFQNYILMTTQILSNSNYFGQQQILSNSDRIQNAKCLSLSCLLLEIPLQKVNKLLFYNQFRQVLQSTAKQKHNQRLKKIDNYLNFRCNNKKQPLSSQSNRKSQQNMMTFQKLNKQIYTNCNSLMKQDIKISLDHKKSKIVHGNHVKIPDLHPVKLKAQNFSMLQVNRTVFESSLKKYRSFSVYQKRYQKSKDKTPIKRQRQGRSLFKMWKVLNLHNILQQQQRYTTQQQQGIQFYNSHMRKLKHLNQIKSYRPKTISSNCRIKQEYIDYLQNN